MLPRRALFALALQPLLRASQPQSLRGRIRQDSSLPPAVLTANSIVTVQADPPTLAVLRDPRLANEDFEALGHFSSPTSFAIEPIHVRARFLYRDGKRLLITYWCEVCAIRDASPGPCRCCQEETALDPRDPSLPVAG